MNDWAQAYAERKGCFMATAIHVPVEVYLSTSDYEPDAEYVDGEIEERPMGEFDHASWQQAIQHWFLLHGKDWNVRVRAELRVQVASRRYRVPDVSVIDKTHPIEQILTHPPIAVFEILSPEDRMPRIMRKLADYEQMGIQTIVVIDTELRAIYQYHGGSLQKLEAPIQNLAGSQCSIDWQKVEELID